MSAPTWAETPAGGTKETSASAKQKKHTVDLSGKARKGKASYYGKKFHGKKMADGTPMDPNANIAASKTLPLGTKAKVTNLENGKSEIVEIRDRGPYVDGRIVDVTPRVAEKLGMKKDGVATVEVKPLELPVGGAGKQVLAADETMHSSGQ
ncbi:MAG TPA: septal ring lytic transglycosylase RlpA family protein [Noviherbaspirillum sp.]|nr:septal ring lytic transglycosylase RlpA family protein [Noviherbaspirillum sp.]